MLMLVGPHFENQYSRTIQLQVSLGNSSRMTALSKQCLQDLQLTLEEATAKGNPVLTPTSKCRMGYKHQASSSEVKRGWQQFKGLGVKPFL